MFQLIRKESGEGIVCAVGGGRVFVAPLPPGGAGKSPSSGKKGCGPSGGCGNCGGCLPAEPVPGGYAGRFRVDDAGGGYYPGDLVRFERFIPEPNLISALVFGLPTASALAAMLFWIAKAPDQVESAPAVFSIIAAFFAGIFVTGIIDRLFKIKYPPAIVGSRDNINGSGDGDDL